MYPTLNHSVWWCLNIDPMLIVNIIKTTKTSGKTWFRNLWICLLPRRNTSDSKLPLTLVSCKRLNETHHFTIKFDILSKNWYHANVMLLLELSPSTEFPFEGNIYQSGCFTRKTCVCTFASEPANTHIFYASFGPKPMKERRLICFIRKDLGCWIFLLAFLLMLTSIKINKITLNYGKGEKRERPEILFLLYWVRKWIAWTVCCACVHVEKKDFVAIKLTKRKAECLRLCLKEKSFIALMVHEIS